MNDTFVIIPVYNESAVLQKTIEDVLAYNYTIVVVDDGSENDISFLVKKYPIFLLRHRFNLGQGAALQTGITFSLKKGAKNFVTFDADGQHRASDIAPMIEKLNTKNLDIIFGSRFLSVTPTKLTLLRKLVLNAARIINYFFSGILLSDAHNGLRVFNKHSASMLNILENRMAHATEILILARKNKLKYGEYPVLISYTGYSKKKGQKLSHSFKILQDIILYKLFK